MLTRALRIPVVSTHRFYIGISVLVAVIAAMLMLAYLYRQIELGRIRERTTPSAEAAATPPS